MGDLKQDTYTVSGLSFRIFSGAVLQVLHDVKRALHGLMTFNPFAVHHCSDSAVIMFKRRAVQPLKLVAHLPLPPCLFLFSISVCRFHKTFEKRVGSVGS